VNEDMDDPIESVKVKKKAGRPPKAKAVVAAVQAQGIAPTAEQWGVLMETLKSNKLADVEVAATINAKAMKKALRPENEIAPGISVYNPRGEQAYPRDKPTHIYMIGPYPICDPGNYDTTTATEIALLNQVRPGMYPVTKSDGSSVRILVKSDQDASNKPYRTVIFADGKGIMDDEQKNNWGSLIQILTEITTGETPTQSYARYQREIDALKAQLAASAA
jgi:hypothetical protein